MKRLAKILALYIFALTVMPCSDVHASSCERSCDVEINDQHQEEEHDMDLCSPFCSCDCCQTIAETLEQSATVISTVKPDLFIRPSFKICTDFKYSFWNPPKS